MMSILIDVLLQPSPPFLFFSQYAVPLLDNLFKVFSSFLKAKNR